MSDLSIVINTNQIWYDIAIILIICLYSAYRMYEDYFKNEVISIMTVPIGLFGMIIALITTTITYFIIKIKIWKMLGKFDDNVIENKSMFDYVVALLLSAYPLYLLNKSYIFDANSSLLSYVILFCKDLFVIYAVYINYLVITTLVKKIYDN